MTKVSLFEVLQAERAIILQSLSELSDLTPEDALDRRSLELRLEQLDEELAQAPLPPLETGDDHAQLAALAAAAQASIQLPAEASLFGEPVRVLEILYGGQPRRGLTATCRRGPHLQEVSLFDLEFPEGSSAIRHAERYRRWVQEPPRAATHPAPPGSQRDPVEEVPLTASRSSPSGAQRGPAEEATRPAPLPVRAASELPASPSSATQSASQIELLVVSRKKGVLRCRYPGSDRTVSLRIALRDEVPGELISFVPQKSWTFMGRPYLSGDLVGHRVDPTALGLAPLALRATVPERVGTRRAFALQSATQARAADRSELERRLTEAIELQSAGADEGAEAILMDVLYREPRCIEAHALLGDLYFESLPSRARRHYAVGVGLGTAALGPAFDGVLPWDAVENRPFLHCLYAEGCCAWKLGAHDEASALLDRVLSLDPADPQGVRANLAQVKARQPWTPIDAAPRLVSGGGATSGRSPRF